MVPEGVGRVYAESINSPYMSPHCRNILTLSFCLSPALSKCVKSSKYRHQLRIFL